MEGVVRLDPLSQSRSLPCGWQGVKVPRKHSGHLKVESGEKPPKHRENGGGVVRKAYRRHWTEVQDRVGLGNDTKLVQQRIVLSQIVIKSHPPFSAKNVWYRLEVTFETKPILFSHHMGRSLVPVEDEGNDMLVWTMSP